MHGSEPVSPWIARWSHLVAENSRVLDVACGAGRHTLHFLKRNCLVVGVDIAQNALDLIASQLSTEQAAHCRLVCADLENKPWPLPDETFDAVIVTHYLWRPLWPRLVQSLAPDGILIYETFCTGNETVGKPSRPDFLLQNGELLRFCTQQALRVVAFEDGFLDAPPRFMQRIVAVQEKSTLNQTPRYHL